MENKACINSIILPAQVKELQEELRLKQEELKSIPSTDLSENEVWHTTKELCESLARNYNKAVQELEAYIATERDRTGNIIRIGDLLRITRKDTGKEQVLCFRHDGDTLIQGVISKETLLGRAIKDKPEGTFTILPSSDEPITFNVEIIREDEEDIINSYIERYNQSPKEMVRRLMEEV